MKRVIFFSMEVGLDDRFPYAGGLGGVAGSIARAAYRSKEVEMTVVTLAYTEGYYDQQLGHNGMEVHYKNYDYGNILKDTGVRVGVRLGDNPNVLVRPRVLDPEVFQTCPIILVDTDWDGNDFLSRQTTKRLYQGPETTRICQEIVLGIGGIRALQALGMPLWNETIIHLNESSTVLAAIELLRQRMEQGQKFIPALGQVRKKVVFTTHTPVLAGNQPHDTDLMIRLGAFPGLKRDEINYLGGGDPYSFSPTPATLRLTRKATGVSEEHRKTANRMWSWVKNRCEITGITNGMSAALQSPEFREAYTAEKIRELKEKYNGVLVNYGRQKGIGLKDGRFTLVWGRRFAGYKRPWLVFKDWPWFEDLLKSNKIQVVFAGKPYPADQEAINLWNFIWQKSRELPNLAILAGYEIRLMQLLHAGAHVWLNTPRPPEEACGDWGMLAAMDGAVYMSSRDGWVLEWIKNEENGFLFGPEQRYEDQGEQDRQDAEGLKRAVERAIDIFYHQPEHWWEIALAGKINAETNFSSQRMLEDYIKKLYE